MALADVGAVEPAVYNREMSRKPKDRSVLESYIGHKFAEQVAYEDLSWFRRILRKYTNSFSVARSSLFWALLRREKKTLKWLFIVMIIYTAGLLQVTNLTRGMIDNGIVNIVVGFAPLKPAEFVVIKIQQIVQQAQA